MPGVVPRDLEPLATLGAAGEAVVVGLGIEVGGGTGTPMEECLP